MRILAVNEKKRARNLYNSPAPSSVSPLLKKNNVDRVSFGMAVLSDDVLNKPARDAYLKSGPRRDYILSNLSPEFIDKMIKDFGNDDEGIKKALLFQDPKHSNKTIAHHANAKTLKHILGLRLGTGVFMGMLSAPDEKGRISVHDAYVEKLSVIHSYLNDEDAFKKLCATQDLSGNTVFHKVDNLEKLEFLSKNLPKSFLAEQMFKPNKAGRIPLHYANSSTAKFMLSLLGRDMDKIEEALLYKDASGLTPVHVFDADTYKAVFSSFKEDFSNRTIYNSLSKAYTKDGSNILHGACDNKFTAIIDDFKPYRSFLDQRMLVHANKQGRLPVHTVWIGGFQALADFYKDNPEKLMKQISTPDKHGQTAFHTLEEKPFIMMMKHFGLQDLCYELTDKKDGKAIIDTLNMHRLNTLFSHIASLLETDRDNKFGGPVQSVVDARLIKMLKSRDESKKTIKEFLHLAPQVDRRPVWEILPLEKFRDLFNENKPHVIIEMMESQPQKQFEEIMLSLSSSSKLLEPSKAKTIINTVIRLVTQTQEVSESQALELAKKFEDFDASGVLKKAVRVLSSQVK